MHRVLVLQQLILKRLILIRVGSLEGFRARRNDLGMLAHQNRFIIAFCAVTCFRRQDSLRLKDALARALMNQLDLFDFVCDTRMFVDILGSLLRANFGRLLDLDCT